ncbi:hypothetical protein FZEAL_3245 [Fusarium zealandicum]|uniref:Uncharacterized protein n=1 Tax=Fusarium zealandicum TaxID=1053134 RepID=A0A8H4UP59_9HYPO|nr:hypothetical protein FZEAL_3245 [Fusarium zealandicum]
MKIQSLLFLGLAPLPLLAQLNAYEILMFYDMYRSDYDTFGEKAMIARGCKDCEFDQFIEHIDRMGSVSTKFGAITGMKDPDLEDIIGWDSAETFIYDPKKLLGGLWTMTDSSGSRMGHPTVVERLVDRMSEVRREAEPARMESILEIMEISHLSRRKSQAKDLLSFVNSRLSSARLGTAKTQSIPFFQEGEFDEFDSTATIESVQRTKRPTMRETIVDLAKDINSGSVSKRSVHWEGEGVLVKRAFGDGMIVMSLQRGLDALRIPVKRKC